MYEMNINQCLKLLFKNDWLKTFLVVSIVKILVINTSIKKLSRNVFKTYFSSLQVNSRDIRNKNCFFLLLHSLVLFSYSKYSLILDILSVLLDFLEYERQFSRMREVGSWSVCCPWTRWEEHLFTALIRNQRKIIFQAFDWLRCLGVMALTKIQ